MRDEKCKVIVYSPPYLTQKKQCMLSNLIFISHHHITQSVTSNTSVIWEVFLVLKWLPGLNVKALHCVKSLIKKSGVAWAVLQTALLLVKLFK